MSTQRYTVTPHPVGTILTWVEAGQIAIPEIQRPFVWEATKVRNLLDSLYQGFPVGYLIAWQNPTVRLKDGSFSAGKRILIDGQQRVTALMAAILGQEVLTKDSETTRIRIAFNPQEERFEVSNPAILKDKAWFADVSELFASGAKLLEITMAYVAANDGTDANEIFRALENLRGIKTNQVGIIDLAPELDIETVTEIFIRVNSAGATLSQADFAMSKIAANETYGGNALRKAIDYFCHLAVAPEFFGRIEKNDPVFAATDFFRSMRWLKDVNDDIYDPTYTDMLRVAFTSEFKRGKLSDLVALLSGRNFGTRVFEESIAAESFERLGKGIAAFINETHFKRITMILRSAGFETSDLISGQNSVNFAYILFLRGRAEGMNADDLERLVRRWYAMSLLRGRYTGAPETAFDLDMRQVELQGMKAYVENVIATELPDSFWTGMLPQLMDTSSTVSPYFLAYKAAQVKKGDRGFLSRDITVLALLKNRSDVHHFYPANHLKQLGLQRGRYNQIANFVICQSEINIAIGDKAPSRYLSELLEQCNGGPKRYGGITDLDELRENFRMNCIPEVLLDGPPPLYESFLEQRRRLMALKILSWFQSL
ncbi:hypothetical protein AYO38_09710 [bacterium SCGC AG-212-C10]|nr:hypothetical protein AYO38_09710 [bacterium SCGC AG-212-C10]